MSEVSITLAGYTFAYSISPSDERKYLDAMKNNSPISDEAVCEVVAGLWIGELIEAARNLDEINAVEAAKASVVPITITRVP